MNEYQGLDASQMDLLNKKMQQMESDPVLNEELPSSKLVTSTQKDVTEAATTATHPSGIGGITEPTNAMATTEKQEAIKAKIAQIENELGSLDTTVVKADDVTFRDETGAETFYVKNICGKHFILSDLQIDKIPAGAAVDMLQMASLEDLKKSRDLRKAIRGVGPERTLKRLTEREYLEEKRQELANKKRLDIVKHQEHLRQITQPNNRNTELLPHERSFEPALTKNTIRPVIEAKLGKLALRSDKDPENRKQAMSSYEFIDWVQRERLSHAEIENIMGNPSVVDDHDIRAALLEKKKSTPPE